MCIRDRLINAGGLRLRPRVRATLEVESGTNDPFAVFLALLLVEILLVGHQSWAHAFITFARDAVLGAIIGVAGGRVITLVLNRLSLAQGLHAPFVTVSALVVFAFANEMCIRDSPCAMPCVNPTHKDPPTCSRPKPAPTSGWILA